jgi:L-alanine-DL-glutamate epimerase-like enolase superfamily enzyme
MPEVELKTLHLTTPFRIAHGTSSTRQVVRIHEAGAVGEAPFVPYYGEDAKATVAWLRGVKEILDPVPAQAPRAGRLALDLLQLDLKCRGAGVPLSSLVPPTLPRREGRIPACRSLSIPTDLTSFARLVAETAKQFGVLKLKLGCGDLEFDEQIVAAARRTAPTAKILVDVNGGWSVKEAALMIPRLGRHSLELIEQPIHHAGGLEAWRELRKALPPGVTSLFADESAQAYEDVTMLKDLVEGVNVKLLKCGSFAGAITMIEEARIHGLQVLLGCMIESSIGVTAAAHLAPWADWVDLDGHLYLADDDYSGVLFDANGYVEMPDQPGIGASRR